MVAFFNSNYNALSTFPDLRHLVQTSILFVDPSTTALTLLKLGFQVRLFFIFEKVTLFPDIFPLPQTSHPLAMKSTSLTHKKIILNTH